MPDNDTIVLEDAKDAAFALDKAFRRAMRDRDLDKMTKLKPKVDEAAGKLGQVRLMLLEEGVVTTDADVAELRRIRAEIDDAADTMELIEGAAKLAGMLGRLLL